MKDVGQTEEAKKDDDVMKKIKMILEMRMMMAMVITHMV